MPLGGGVNSPHTSASQCNTHVVARHSPRSITRVARSRTQLLALVSTLRVTPFPIPPSVSQTPSGFDRTGPGRARFLLEAVADLRQRLRDVGSERVVRLGRPEVVLREVAVAVGADAVYCQSEVTAEEMQVGGSE